MKKLTLVALLCIVLAGCGSEKGNSSASAGSTPSSGPITEAAVQPAETAIATGESDTPVSADYPVTLAFGDWSDDGEQLLLNVRDMFTRDETISFGMEMPEKFGVKTLTVNLYKAGNGQLLDSWEETVDPDWESLAYEFLTPDTDGALDPGQYELAVFKDSTRIGEGSFNVE